MGGKRAWLWVALAVPAVLAAGSLYLFRGTAEAGEQDLVTVPVRTGDVVVTISESQAAQAVEHVTAVLEAKYGRQDVVTV